MHTTACMRDFASVGYAHLALSLRQSLEVGLDAQTTVLTSAWLGVGNATMTAAAKATKPAMAAFCCLGACIKVIPGRLRINQAM